MVIGHVFDNIEMFFFCKKDIPHGSFGRFIRDIQLSVVL